MKLEIIKGYEYHINTGERDINNLGLDIIELLRFKNELEVFDVKLTNNFQLIILTSNDKNSYFEQFGNIISVTEVDIYKYDEGVFEVATPETIKDITNKIDSNVDYEYRFVKE